MNRDYVNYKRKRHRQTKPVVWFAAVIFCALVVAAAVYIYKNDFSVAGVKTLTNSNVAGYFSALFHKDNKPVVAKKRIVTAPEIVKPIHFDFYNELPKAQLDALPDQSEEEEETVAENPSLVAPVVEKKNVEKQLVQQPAIDQPAVQPTDHAAYILQLGVFHNIEAANRYGAALVSAGLKIELVKIQAAKEVIYRLQQGPYHNPEQLRQAKKRLTERGIACDVLKLPPYVM